MAPQPPIPSPSNIVHIYVTDLENNRLVRMNTLDGVGWVSLGSIGNGVNQFHAPWGVFVEPKNPPAPSPSGFGSGAIYVTDSSNNRVVRINDMTGAGWTTIGTQGAGVKQFNAPAGLYVAWDHLSFPPKRHIYVADRLNHRIVRFDDMGGAGWKTFGTQGDGIKQFNEPTGIHVDHQGRIYVADRGNTRVARIDNMSGAGWTTVASNGNHHFNMVTKVVVDKEDRIYVSDWNRIARMYDMTGGGWSTFGSLGQGANQFEWATGIHVQFPKIYTADYKNDRIARSDCFGSPGWKTIGTSGSGINQFSGPMDIFVG